MDSRWEMVDALPAPALRPYVIGRYVGWVEESPRPQPRRELATLRVPIIINLGPDYLIEMGGKRDHLASFLAGVSSIPALVTGSVRSAALQLDLSPLGAWALLGVPLLHLSNRVTPLEELPALAWPELIARLHEAHTWDARFDLLDMYLSARLAQVRQPDTRVTHIWSSLQASNGQVSIEALARETGWSRKQLFVRFREQIGIAPKVAARVMRFETLVSRASQPTPKTWTELAMSCGYFDQSHLNRDFAEFAGTTPSAWLSERPAP